MSADELRVSTDSGDLMLYTGWLRTTLNPVAPKYPKTGDVITIKTPYSFFLSEGKHTVEIVEEFEPANNVDEDGRDIRISFVGNQHKLLNGKQILEHMA